MTPEYIDIICSLPGRVLSPNYHTRELNHRASAVAFYREMLGLYGVSVKLPSMPWAIAELELAFYFPDNRRRDLDNYATRMKPGIDGLVDAGLIVDDSWQHLCRRAPKAAVDENLPRVEITLYRVD